MRCVDHGVACVARMLAVVSPSCSEHNLTAAYYIVMYNVCTTNCMTSLTA
jgi:hypothetical protein|eukprot:COSAG01_NODE_687_length_14245_cov_40.399548_12_plen_50_part_00